MPVAFPMFTKENPLELTFSYTPDGSSFILYLDPSVARNRFDD